ncbi:MAG: chloramphenicol acetyltransferase [Bacteroidia bacterium]|nr:chloramphenicol acetyltransferase [Bacteroidia bacterium]
MYTWLDTDTWYRRQQYEFFRQYEMPFFNMTSLVDVTRLRARSAAEGSSFFLLSLHASLQAAQEIEPFRYRIEGDRVVVYEVIHAGSTILHEDQSFGFCYFPYEADAEAFCAAGVRRIAVQQAHRHLDPHLGQQDIIHYSVIPWIHFSSFQHARRLGKDDSIPKIVFGQYQRDPAGRYMMPVSVEVHHALADGLHVGQYLARFQALLDV